jgi:hypothetical protein
MAVDIAKILHLLPKEIAEQSSQIYVTAVNEILGESKILFVKDRGVWMGHTEFIPVINIAKPEPEVDERLCKTVNHGGFEISIKAPLGVQDFDIDGLRADLVVVPKTEFKHISVHIWDHAEGVARDGA